MFMTQKIVDALRAAVGEEFGGQRIFAQKVGTSCANVSRWINGKNRRISDDSWKKILPHLKDHLPDGVKKAEGRNSSLRTPDAGVTVNIFGVPYSRVVGALKSATFLTDEQKRELIVRIFYDDFDGGELAKPDGNITVKRYR